MSRRILIEDPKAWGYQDGTVSRYDNVIGHVLVMVVKQEDGSVTLEREIAVNADSFEDNQLAEATVKEIEGKFNEFLPKPEFVVYDENPKIWIPE